MVQQVTYRAHCTNEDCGYIMKKSWSFRPQFVENEVCPQCSSKYEVRGVEDDSTTTSAGIINNRGELHTRLSGDFRDLMQKIKDGSPHCHMRDFK